MSCSMKNQTQGMPNLKLRSLVKSLMVCHAWVENAMESVERCYDGALDGSDTRGLAIIGESGSGKTRILKHVANKYAPEREADGLKVPVLLVSVPSNPTVKGLAMEILHALGDPLFDKGSETAMTIRLRKLLMSADTKLLALDEFQHFVDQAGKKIQHHVADWLKILVDDVEVSLVVAGLPRCTYVIDSNPQLKRRFQAPAVMPRFNWGIADQRMEFRSILDTMQDGLAPFVFPDLSTDEMAFRVYCATGGLMGRIANLLKQTITNAIYDNKTQITLEDLNRAAKKASFDLPTGIKAPFSRDFDILPSEDVIAQVMTIGVEEDLPLPNSSGRPGAPKRVSDVFRR